jgi:hypothetical protein
MAGQRDQRPIVQVAVAGPAGQDGQERVGEQGQDGPPVPGGPAPDLVLVQGSELFPPANPSSTFHRGPATFTSWVNGTGRGA